jgi:Secretion system C-terminal sorting domain/Galactose oxidase, central domain
VGTGDTQFGSYYNDLWAFDPVANTWTQKTNLTGSGRAAGTAFAINNEGYLGTGTDEDTTVFSDFWKYNTITDSWSQIQDIPQKRYHGFGFDISDNGYVGTGTEGIFPNLSLLSDFWCYCNTTGIEEDKSINKISIYPNPASKFLQIHLDPFSKDYKIDLTDMSGVIVRTDIPTENNFKFLLSGVSKGKYILNIFDKAKLLKSEKIIIN